MMCRRFPTLERLLVVFQELRSEADANLTLHVQLELHAHGFNIRGRDSESTCLSPSGLGGLKSLPVLRNWSDILKKIISGIASSLESFVFYKCISHAGGSPLSIQFLSKNILRKKNYLNSVIPFSNVVISAKGLGLLNPMLFTAKTRN